jgi:hypothetical protein
VGATGVEWNYTTVLNIVFLLLAAALLVRFFRSGGPAMLKMMGGGPDEHAHHGAHLGHAAGAPALGHDGHRPPAVPHEPGRQ